LLAQLVEQGTFNPKV